MAVSEFSAGTADEARFACTDRSVLRVQLGESSEACQGLCRTGFLQRVPLRIFWCSKIGLLGFRFR